MAHQQNQGLIRHKRVSPFLFAHLIESLLHALRFPLFTEYFFVHTIKLWNLNGTTEKNLTNHVKHKVSFELARLVFDDPLHLAKLDQVVGG